MAKSVCPSFGAPLGVLGDAQAIVVVVIIGKVAVAIAVLVDGDDHAVP
jgi:hypothetical protein